VDRPAPTLELDGRRIPLTRAVTVLGRAADVDVPLDDAGVSRRHAEVHVTDGRYRVVDLGSTNGTFVDGERVTTGELRDGSTITVGRSRLVFRLGQR
jgi:pSer/pThr/pTyr-binding forkhead associated (FHA) protein